MLSLCVARVPRCSPLASDLDLGRVASTWMFGQGSTLTVSVDASADTCLKKSQHASIVDSRAKHLPGM